MKKYILCIYILFIYFSVLGQNSGAVKTHSFKGNVLSVEETECKTPQNKECYTILTKYNFLGYPDEELHTNHATIPNYNISYYYNMLNICTKTISTLWGKSTFQYDTIGKLTATNIYDTAGKLYSRIMYYYDANNNWIEERQYSLQTQSEIRYVFEYNSANQKIKTSLFFDKQEKPAKYDNFEYQEDGSYTVTIYYYPYSKQSIKYYTSKGNITEAQYFGDKYTIHTYKYTFDRHGNWVERNEFCTDTHSKKPYLYNKTTRIITYW